ncbi:MAG TPA: SMR family transporter [Microbacterium sp.]|uniref:SMR family transporter n=1 Tax=Microbacterium sp. TaxID=51671 RepID=UPI002B71E187|nr:SMR family transporter [Microbacterium sp.]HWI31793.1 SMR family transporter [Microbacterium sp.]
MNETSTHQQGESAAPRPRIWAILALAIALEVSATLALRAALDNPWWWVVTAAGYLGALAALAVILRRGGAIGSVYGIWAACGVALTALLAALLFGDALTAPMLVGIVIVMGGVMLVETGRAPSARPERSAAEVER